MLDIRHVKDGVVCDVAEKPDLARSSSPIGPFSPAEDEVREDADLAEGLDGVLRGLGLQLARSFDEGDVGDVDVRHRWTRSKTA